MIIKHFQEQVRRTPQHTALKWGSKSLTYSQLDTHSNRVGHALLKCLKTDRPAALPVVSLLFRQGGDMITALLGTLKAGALYVPMDATYPLNRLAYMRDDSQTQVILTHSKHLELAQSLAQSPVQGSAQKSESKIEILLLDQLDAALPDTLPEVEETPEQGAYILYTSGSTGRPKGVMQRRESVMHFSTQWSRCFDITASDRIAQFASLSHDGAIPDIYSALLNGATLHPYDIKEEANLDRLEQWLLEQEITVWHSVPTFYRYFVHSINGETIFPHLRWFILGGEEVREHDVTLFTSYFPESRFANIYGQTESTINSIWTFSPREFFRRILIGDAVADTELLVIDEDGDVIEEMGSGEIVVASPYVASGYWRNEEESRRVFSTHPELGGLYRTGDIVQLMADGSMAILGRKDRQVKIRGFRVETGEIESRLLAHPDVKEAVVVAKKNDNDENTLAAYITTGENLQTKELNRFLAPDLPDFMMPFVYVKLDHMPLTPSGKIDRRALPEPDEVEREEKEFTAPTTPTERKLAKLWAGMLDDDAIGIHTDFFKKGGHSLMMITMITRIHQEFDVELQLQDMFENPTIFQQAELITLGRKSLYTSIEPAPQMDAYPQSSSQRRIYFMEHLEGSDTSYNMPLAYRIEGTLDPRHFNRALQQVVSRHEALRTSFEIRGDEAVQVIHLEAELTVVHEELENEPDKAAIKAIIQDFIRPFDLSRAPLFRVKRVSWSEQQNLKQQHLVLLDTHHIVSDGISTGILFNDFISFYQGGEPEPLRIQFKDFTLWQNGIRESGQIKAQEDYWLKRFADGVPRLELPADFARPAQYDFHGDFYGFAVGEELSGMIRELCEKHDVTMFMVILALLNVLLSKYSGQEDVVVGSSVAGRQHADLQPVMGMFVNELVLWNKPLGRLTFSQFLKEVKHSSLEAFESRDVQFEYLVEKLNPERDPSRNPLFDVCLSVLQSDSSDNGDSIDDLTFTPMVSESKVAQFDLTLFAEQLDRQISCMMTYRTSLFKAETIVRMCDHFLTIARQVCANPDTSMESIDILSPQEHRWLLSDCNPEPVAFPADQTIHGLFEARALKAPQKVAVQGQRLGQDGQQNSLQSNHQLTYEELNREAAQLAQRLMQQGVAAGNVVALTMARSVDLVVAVLAILKTGATYLPIDPNFPQQRIQYLLEDSAASLLLEDGSLTGNHMDLSQQWHTLNYQAITAENQPAVDAVAPQTSIDSNSSATDATAPAYLIYTSGSTGKPKGVLVSHRNAVNYLHWAADVYVKNESINFPLFTSISFDLTVTSLFLPLLTGNQVIVYGEEQNLLLIDTLIRDKRLGAVKLTPSHLKLLRDTTVEKNVDKTSIKRFIVGGEDLNSQLASDIFRKFDGQAEIYNEYGPTEATVGCMIHQYDPGETYGNSVPIGTPADNTRIYLLDRLRQPVPPGVKGEIYIGGAGVAMGYLGQAQLTAQKFPEDPFYEKVNEKGPEKMPQRMYATGDLAIRREDGTVIFLGRKDEQLKVRGFRVEPGEIENRLLSHPHITAAVVQMEEHSHNLHGYIVSTQEPSVPQIRAHLLKYLPEYMIPSRFLHLPAIPLTENGKIDRKELRASANPATSGQTYTAPRNQVESQIGKVWQEVLKLEQVGIHDNYFDVGGTSLDIIKINKRLKENFQMDIPVASMFRYTTIHTMAGFLREEKQELQDRSPQLARSKQDRLKQMDKRRAARV
ncbi:MAG: amino acid adenylation domain-containing protein [bacterium]|nr:amino acid adenylation domain-containing protein [bacterium]